MVNYRFQTQRFELAKSEHLFDLLFFKKERAEILVEEQLDSVHPELNQIPLFVGELVVHVKWDHLLARAELRDLRKKADQRV
jgi:hypothetical protein